VLAPSSAVPGWTAEYAVPLGGPGHLLWIYQGSSRLRRVVDMQEDDDRTVQLGMSLRCECGFEPTDSKEFHAHIRGHGWNVVTFGGR